MRNTYEVTHLLMAKLIRRAVFHLQGQCSCSRRHDGIFRIENPITQSWIREDCENDVVTWIPIAVGFLDCPAKYF